MSLRHRFWIFGPVLKLAGEFEASTKTYPLIAMGTPDPYTLPHRLVVFFGRGAMSGLDILAWIVLIILVASIIAVFCIAGWLPGHIAKARGHPQAQAVTVAGWVTLIFSKFKIEGLVMMDGSADQPHRHSDHPK